MCFYFFEIVVFLYDLNRRHPTVNEFQTNFNLTIPTPFSKKPFEFSTGFRRSFFMFPIAYILTFIAIRVDNFNLAGCVRSRDKGQLRRCHCDGKTWSHQRKRSLKGKF